MKKLISIFMMGTLLGSGLHISQPQPAQAVWLIDQAFDSDRGGGWLPEPGPGFYCAFILGLIFFPVCLLGEEGQDSSSVYSGMEDHFMENGYTRQEARELVELRISLDEELDGKAMFLEQEETRETFGRELRAILPQASEDFADLLYDHLPYLPERQKESAR